VLTPPDPVSQIGLALPTIILYEIAIYCARLVERQRAAAKAERDAEDTESSAASDPEGDA
jgi:sec-independent protein translocase protein TatC